MFNLILGQQWPASGMPGKQRGCRLASGNSSDFQRGKSHYRSSEKSLAVLNHAIKGGRGVCKRTRWKCRLYVVGVLLAPSWFPPCLQTSRRQCRFRIGKKWPAILIGRNHIWSCMTRLGPRHIAVFRSRSDMAYIVLSIFQQGLRVHELLADGQKHTLPTGIPEISRP